MTDTDRKHVVMLVANDVVRDSRVMKTALAVASAGARVTVVGISPTKESINESAGKVRIIRVPVEFQLRNPARLTAKSTSWPRAIALKILIRIVRTPSARALDAKRLRYKLRKHERSLKADQLRVRLESSPLRALAPAVLRPVHAAPYRARILGLKYLTRAQSIVLRAQLMKHRKRNAAVSASVKKRERRIFRKPGGWRNQVLRLQDIELAVMPVISELGPDLIHAHDFSTIQIGHHAALLAHAQGRDVKFIYDAHENVRGLPVVSPKLLAAYGRLEKEHIRAADAVITVSPALARLLEEEYRLPERPRVVLNTPLATGFDPGSDLSVRAAAGVDADVPLLVYSGVIKPQSGVDTLVRALAHMPAVHCALVTKTPTDRHVRALVELAATLECSDRLHLVPSVDSIDVTNYLRTADIGVHTLLPSGNASIALPTKLFEYLHAGLPVVVSDVEAMADFIARHEVGKTFEPGNSTALAAVCQQVLENLGQFREALSALDLRMTYSWESQASEVLIPLYRELLGRGIGEPSFPSDRSHYEALAAARTDRPVPAPGPAKQKQPFAPIRLGVGPRNMGGQASAWAAAVSRELGVAAESFATEIEGSFIFPADRRIAQDDWLSPEWQISWSQHVIAAYTHLLVELGLSPLGGLNGYYFDADLAWLRDHGVELAIVSRGSEVRDPRVHRILESDSPFADPDDHLTRRLQGRVDDLLPRINAFEGVKFVSTLDLLTYVRDAVWLPLVVDLNLWAADQPPLERQVPVVVHAPTQGQLKGSEFADRACQPLAERGLIEYKRLTGIPAQEIPRQIKQADIVLDQFAIGDYGALACQALAAGRCVIGHVSEAIRTLLPEPLPILEARGKDLPEVLEAVLDDRSASAEAASAGRRFAETFHDGLYSARQLAPFLGCPWPDDEADADARVVVSDGANAQSATEDLV